MNQDRERDGFGEAADHPTPRWPNQIRDPASVHALAERYWSAITPADAAAEREFEAAFPAVRQRGELDKDLFVKLARWKSKRKTPSYLANPEEAIREQSRRAFRATTRADAIAAICVLEGVALRTATALLQWMRPDEFPILDFRVLEAVGWPEPQSCEDAAFYDAFATVIIAQSRTLGVSLRILDRALWWSKVRGGAPAATAQAPRPVVATPPTAPAASPNEGQVPCWITNIASHPERARSGDRCELCIAKKHAARFPADGGTVELVIDGHRWRGTIGHKAKVAHIYFHTRLIDDLQREDKITAVLRRAGFDVGDRPCLRATGRHSFALQRGQHATS